MAEKYMSTFTKAQLMSADTIVCATGQFNKLGEYVIPAGMEIAIGSGKYDDLERATGRLFIELKDDEATATIESGMVRLQAYSPQNRPLEILYEGRTEVTGAGTNRQLYVPLPEHSVNLTQDQKLVMEFMPDGADTVVKADCTILVDHTVFII